MAFHPGTVMNLKELTCHPDFSFTLLKESNILGILCQFSETQKGRLIFSMSENQIGIGSPAILIITSFQSLQNEGCFCIQIPPNYD